MNQAINLSRGPGTDEGVDNNLQITIYMFQVQSKYLLQKAIVMNIARHEVK